MFNPLNEEFGFTLDVCASPDNHKCRRFLSILDDGLSCDWSRDTCWMNPPYGRAIGKWMQKAYEESQRCATVVCLVPARTDTNWWWDYAMKGEIRFIRGRIKFLLGGDLHHSAPFPSAIVIFHAWRY